MTNAAIITWFSNVLTGVIAATPRAAPLDDKRNADDCAWRDCLIEHIEYSGFSGEARWYIERYPCRPGWQDERP